MNPPEPMIAMIEVENLTRIFRTYRKRPGFWGGVRGLFHREFTETVAARDITFSIGEGELVGFLGPNGAGKTTVLKMLSGLIYPTTGTARVAGFDPKERRSEYRRIFALVLGQKNQLWWDLPARESFFLLRHIYGIPEKQHRETLDELVTLLQVGPKLDVMVRELSLGERMKMELVAALLHRPRVLFLDEPTIGLDLISQRSVRQFLRAYNQTHRTTILLTSHYMEDIKELCRRVVVIHQGSKIYDGDIRLLEGAGTRHKVIRFRPAGDGWPLDWALEGAQVSRTESEVLLRVPAAKVVEACQEILATGPVEDINVQEVPLEDIIHDLFKKGFDPPG